jgi:hypothetical protein
VTHRLIRDTAKDLAGAWYEDNHRTERFRHLWHGDATQFIGRTWTEFVVLARTILTDMLRRSDAEVPLTQKEEIYDALLADRQEAATRRPERAGRGPMMLHPDRPGSMEQHLFWRKH